MALFPGEIKNWEDWGNVFQSITAFKPLVEYILEKENLPVADIENLTPGTNAVFKVGNYVVKIFAPNESGIDQSDDKKTELFAINRANQMGISAPKLISYGYTEDKYHFAYMIMGFINGIEFLEVVKTMTTNHSYRDW